MEAKKIPDIVRYEARQQIPFDLNDVIWDYQRMGGGSEEVGLRAGDRNRPVRHEARRRVPALEPFVKAGIEVDIVQLAPLALYNYVVFDMLQDLPAAGGIRSRQSAGIGRAGVAGDRRHGPGGDQRLQASGSGACRWAAATSPRP